MFQRPFHESSMTRLSRSGAVPALLLATGLVLAGCGKSSEPAPAAPGGDAASVAPASQALNEGWITFRDRFLAETFAANPTFAVYQGQHEFDGQLPDWSEAGLKKEIARLDAARSEALAFKDDQLEAPQRMERDHLLAVLDGNLFWLREAEGPWRNPAYYLGAGLDPSTYLTRPYAPPEVRLKAFVAYARAVPKAVEQIRANLKMPMPKTFIELGVAGFGGFPDFFRKDVPEIFADVKDPALQAELKAAIEPAALALQGLADWLQQNAATANQDFALGPKRFADMLYATERVSTPLSELEAIGRADLDHNLLALSQACELYLPGASNADCMAKAAAEKPAEGPVAAARAELADLRQFIIDQKLVSIPGTEEAQVAEAPPYNRSNAAYIDVPGPYDKGMPSIYYIAPPDPSWSAADQAAYIPGRASLLYTTVHEVWPGHFLQFLHSNRSSSLIGQLFVGYAFAEGWAHYSEQMMFEAGLKGDDPEYRIGQLGEALLRNVRYLCAIGLHTQGMTVETCEQMFREQGFQDPGNAKQQAARGTYDPAYMNYTMGKLMILKLRDDWVATHGGRDAWGSFHDQFLSYGGPPIPLVRKAMLGPEDTGSLFPNAPAGAKP
jgi:uncharacterized protein (DUF885 family)